MDASNQYAVILADPPWNWKAYSSAGEKRSAKRHYEVLEQGDFCDLPVSSVTTDDCVLFLWCINSMLPNGLQLIDDWGFTFKTIGFVWIKENSKADTLFMGLGYHTRQNAEICLIGTKGKPKRRAKDVHQVIISKRREHSRKPDEVYERIERLYPGPYLEMFSRTDRNGWDQWGDQVGRWTA